jgi:hypothetical protein
MPDHDIIEIEVRIKSVTELAWLVQHAAGECWLPKSEVAIIGGGAFVPLRAAVPKWLAEREGLL